VSLLGCVFSALTRNSWQLALARVFLGLGIGPNSATTPMFAAECAPPRIRGAMVMVG
jgi:MFS family permease